jgi:GNAT superfamily N-acetyltransferase
MNQESRTNFEEKVSYLARLLPDMIVTDQDGLLSVDCGLPSDTFNVTVIRDLSAPAKVLARSADCFTSKGFPVALWYWESEEDKAGMSELLQQGLSLAETNTAMSVELSDTLRTSPQIEGLEIQRAVTAHDVLHVGEVMLALFGDSDEGHSVFTYYQHLSEYPLSTFPAMHFYLGRLYGTVVATGLVFVGSRTVGIYDVATRPEYRKRGIGSAMFQYLLEDACTSHHRSCVLQASQAGLRIYLQAGFRSVGTVHVFENRGLL